MVFSQLSHLFHSLTYLSPPGFLLTLAPAFIARKSYLTIYIRECIATLLMVGLTFTPGKWIAVDNVHLSYLLHAIGVVLSDSLGGGQHVNPSMTIAMWSMNQCDYTEAYVRIAGQMMGGLIAFPLCDFIRTVFGLLPLGGPEYKDDNSNGAMGAWSEFMATFLLCIAVCILNFRLHFGRFHYWVKQFLTAFVVRVLIQSFPKTGPAMNPMLATTWAIFVYGEYPSATTSLHYFVYWFSSILGALVGIVTYLVFVGGFTFFGMKLPVGPILATKKKIVSASKKKK